MLITQRTVFTRWIRMFFVILNSACPLCSVGILFAKSFWMNHESKIILTPITMYQHGSACPTVTHCWDTICQVLLDESWKQNYFDTDHHVPITRGGGLVMRSQIIFLTLRIWGRSSIYNTRHYCERSFTSCISLDYEYTIKLKKKKKKRFYFYFLLFWVSETIYTYFD